MANQFEASEAPSDVVSALRFSPFSDTLVVSSWDKTLSIYDVEGQSCQIRKQLEYRAPVLDTCWGQDDSTVYTVGLDWDVRKVDLESGEQRVLSTHGDAANGIAFSKEERLLISTSWDKTVHLQLVSEPNVPIAILQLPHKPFSLALSETKLVIVMAARTEYIYDLKTLAIAVRQSSGTEAMYRENVLDQEPWQRRESNLKYMTRAVACMSNDAGYASSSIEGRVAVDWFDESADSQAMKYAFKCHRQSGTDGVDTVYPVNTLAFHPSYNTFASGGGDGMVSLWDAVAKKRIRHYQKFQASIAALDFSRDGKYLAIGVSPGYQDEAEDLTSAGPVKIIIRELGEGEAKTKSAK